MDLVLLEVMGLEDISEPLQSIQKSDADVVSDTFKIRKNQTILLHCTDGLRLVNVMILDTSLPLVKAGIH